MKKLYFWNKLSQFGLSLGLALGIILLAGCKNDDGATPPPEAEDDQEVTTEGQEGAEEESNNAYMQAPAIHPDANGLIALSQCPTTDDHLKVVVTGECSTAEIYYDGKLIQTISDKVDGLATDAGNKCPVRFLDANFDGYADIFIGQGESRTYSSLLIWDTTAGQFVRVGKLGVPSLQNFKLHPESRSVIEGGSDSWCESSYSRSIWQNRQLKSQERLVIVSDPSQYEENGVSNKFTLGNIGSKTTKSVASASDLPPVWRSIAADF